MNENLIFLGIYFLGSLINFCISYSTINKINKDNSLGGFIYGGLLMPWILLFIVTSWIGLVGCVVLWILKKLE